LFLFQILILETETPSHPDYFLIWDIALRDNTGMVTKVGLSYITKVGFSSMTLGRDAMIAKTSEIPNISCECNITGCEEVIVVVFLMFRKTFQFFFFIGPRDR